MDLSLKYRPNSFSEIIGQNAVVSILSRQIAKKAWKNAYLFCGSHGCGKTSVARIMAKEINSGEGDPIEIDGASNNGIENIRSLIADSQQSSIDSDFKVYIIDEAHQLTRGAWDAALKLIEEPPSGSIFILCTTNPDKIPDTILSRVQRFDFCKVPYNLIADRLEFIMNEEFPDVPYEKSAMTRMAVLSNGHVRDAIKYLDKMISSVDNITLESVETVFNLVKRESLLRIANGICKKDLSSCLMELEALDKYNENMVSIFDEICNFFIDLAIFSKTKNIGLTNLSDDIRDTIVVSDSYEAVVERLIKYREYVLHNNVLTLLKTVLLEVC